MCQYFCASRFFSKFTVDYVLLKRVNDTWCVVSSGFICSILFDFWFSFVGDVSLWCGWEV